MFNAILRFIATRKLERKNSGQILNRPRPAQDWEWCNGVLNWKLYSEQCRAMQFRQMNGNGLESPEERRIVNHINGRWFVEMTSSLGKRDAKQNRFSALFVLIAAQPHINKEKETINFDKNETTKFSLQAPPNENICANTKQPKPQECGFFSLRNNYLFSHNFSSGRHVLSPRVRKKFYVFFWPRALWVFRRSDTLRLSQTTWGGGHLKRASPHSADGWNAV